MLRKFRSFRNYKKKNKNAMNIIITIFFYLLKISKIIKYPYIYNKNRFLRSFIYQNILKLENNKY